MLLNADKLLKLCEFYKTATLEEDMAKRIMLSIIPAAMSKTEQHFTGGFEYKALRSAANGAKDLVKYGAKACAGEIEHYGAGLIYQYKEYGGNAEKQKQYEDVITVKKAIRSLLDEGKYKECLKLCTESFYKQGEGYWGYHYGGKPWAKISHTLYQIEEKREMLQFVRDEATKRRDDKTDYIGLEIDTMKELIVLMNVFDGLAHNTASVMPNLVSEELNDIMPMMPNLDGIERMEEDLRREKYQHKIKTMMDAKEIEDPLTVYQEIKDIIEQPHNKHLFDTYISRIRNLPEYRNAPTVKDVKGKLEVIKFKKHIKSKMAEIDKALRNLMSLKDTLLNTHDDEKSKAIYKEMYNHSDYIYNELYNIQYIIGVAEKELATKAKMLYDALIAANGPLSVENSHILVTILDELKYCYVYALSKNSLYIKDPTRLITDLHKLKNIVISYNNLIDQYLG